MEGQRLSVIVRVVRRKSGEGIELLPLILLLLVRHCCCSCELHHGGLDVDCRRCRKT